MGPIWSEYKEKNGALVPALFLGEREVTRVTPEGKRKVKEQVRLVFSFEAAQPYKVYDEIPSQEK